MAATVNEAFSFQFAKGIALATEKLSPAHSEYTRQVSSPDMAISIEAAAFLWVLCEHFQPSSILDLGSGFSSFAIRSYAATKPVAVRTVDDDQRWLERTTEFLHTHGLSTENMQMWDESALKSDTPFDLIFYDLGGMDTRARELPIVLEQIGEKTVLVLDDMHKEEYVPTVERALRTGRWRYFDARSFTMDHYGRFCGIVLPAAHALLR